MTVKNWATKRMSLQREEFLGKPRVDLLIERDAGNEVLILMGKPEYALNSWRRLRLLCTKAIKLLEDGADGGA